MYKCGVHAHKYHALFCYVGGFVRTDSFAIRRAVHNQRRNRSHAGPPFGQIRGQLAYQASPYAHTENANRRTGSCYAEFMYSARSSQEVYCLRQTERTSEVDQHRSGQNSEIVQSAEARELGKLLKNIISANIEHV